MRNILPQILDYLGVKYTRKFVKELYSVQPFRESMFGLSVMLKRFHIDSTCAKLSDKEQICNISFPIVIVLGGSFFIVTGIHDEKVSLLTAAGKKYDIPMNDFIEKWDGILLTLRKTDYSIEPDYKTHRKEQLLSQVKMFILCTCAAVLVGAGIASNILRIEWWWYIVMLINLAGIGVGYLLLQKELHIDNELTNRLCGLIKESHCEDVTESKAASFFGLAKMSEIGAGFFFVNFLVLLFFPGAIAAMTMIAIAVLPFTFWSVWYQKFRAHSWCMLCLSTLSLMWLQAVILWIGGALDYYNGIPALISSLIVLLAAYGLTVMTLGRGMMIMKRMKERDTWMLRFNRLKADDKVVNAFMNDMKELEVENTECSSLIFGNPDAEHRITVFSNPYCYPCAMMHEHIKDMPADDCCVQYVLTYFSDDLSDINRYLIAAYQQLGAERAWQIMTDWYAGGKNLKADFFLNMGLDPTTTDVSIEFDKHLHWRTGKSFTGTPTVLVNGREIKAPLSVEDYVYMPIKGA